MINVRNLTKQFSLSQRQAGLWPAIKGVIRPQSTKTLTAVDDISFDIQKGELVGFLGPNGAGKTTTLKMLSGILYPTHGTVTVDGFIPWERKRDYQRQFALVMGQKNQLWWDLPARETFLLNKAIYRIADNDYAARLNELTELLGAQDILDQQVRKLSLGERMKCELIASLLHRPSVLYLDEPTIGLDVISQQKIREFIRSYNREHQTTIMLTSHYMQDIEALCDRVLVINQGKLMYDGRLHELVNRYVDYKLIRLSVSKSIDKQCFEQFGEVREYSPQGALIAVKHDRVNASAAKILTDYPIDEFTIEEVPIEEVVVQFFNENKKTGVE